MRKCKIVITTDRDRKMCPYFYPSSHPEIEGPQCLCFKTYVTNVYDCRLWNYTLHKVVREVEGE